MSGNRSDFKEFIENNLNKGMYVDKTLLIKEVIEIWSGTFIITRPRRWGKSLNMSMLYYYFVHKDQLKGMGHNEYYIRECDKVFENLNICKSEFNDVKNVRGYMRNYPCIWISFYEPDDTSNKANTTNLDWPSIKSLIISQISNLFKKYNYIANDLEIKVKEKVEEYYNNRKLKWLETLKTQDLPKNFEDMIVTDVNNAKLNFIEYRSLQKFYRIRDGNFKFGDLSDSINFLAKILFKFHKKKVFIFIDEYDYLINKYNNQKEILDLITNTLIGIYSHVVNPNGFINNHLGKIIFTGIHRVEKEYSGLEDVSYFSVFDNQFSKFYGFTPEEVKNLLVRCNKIDYINDVEKWYNGYKVGQEILYNPWCVIQFLITNNLSCHWLKTGTYDNIKEIFIKNKGHATNVRFREIMSKGTKGETLVRAKRHVSKEEQPGTIWTYLINTGYLAVSSIVSEALNYDCFVKIPNHEISLMYDEIINGWITQNSHLKDIFYVIFTQNYQSLADKLEQILKYIYREKDILEEVYNSILLADLVKNTYSDRFTLLPEEITDVGRANILLIDKENKNVVSIQLKRCRCNIENLESSAENAVNQAKNKKYSHDEMYKDYQRLPAIGISFCGTNLAIKVLDSDEIIYRYSKKKICKEYPDIDHIELESKRKKLANEPSDRTIIDLKFNKPANGLTENISIHNNMFSLNSNENSNKNIDMGNIINSFLFWSKSKNLTYFTNTNGTIAHLKDEVEKYGYSISFISFNGSLLFRSIMYNLNKTEEFKEITLEEIRDMVIEDLFNFPEKYDDLCCKYLYGSVKEMILINLKNNECWDNMSNIFLVAASRLLNISIIILNFYKSKPTIYRRPIQLNEGERPKVFIGHAGEWCYFPLDPLEGDEAKRNRMKLDQIFENTEPEK
jgi:hypothetical protein